MQSLAHTRVGGGSAAPSCGAAVRAQQQQHHHATRRLHPCRSFLQSLLGGPQGATTAAADLASSEPELTNWLVQRGFAADKLKIVPQKIPGKGTGCVATRPIKAGEQVLALPESLVLFPITAAAESVLSPLLPPTAAETMPDWMLLVLYLAEQQYYLSRGLPLPSTAWAPYLQSLPKQPVGTVLDWPLEEVSTLLAGSGSLQKAQVILAAAEAQWQDCVPFISKAKQQGLCPQDMFSRADIAWATGICLSRSVRLDDKGGVVVLVPFADLINHSCDSKAFLLWDPQQQAVVLRADRAYKPGDEMHISYGFKSSSELLLSYGFCPPPGTNAYDAAHLTLSLELTDPCMQEKKAAMARRGIPPVESFALLIDAMPAGLLEYAAMCAARPKNASAEQIEQLAVQLFDKGAFPDVDGVSSELLALQAVVQQCKAALAGYKQTAAADRQRAQAVQEAGGGFEQRAAVMAAIRAREQQVLSRSEFVASARMRELKRGGSSRWL